MTQSQKTGLKIVVLASGRGSNLQALIDAIERGALQSTIAAVISNKPEAYALQRAKDNGLKAICIPSKAVPTQDFFANITQVVLEQEPDLIVLAGFMKILPANFVETFSNRIINIHPSLLPAFKGLDAQKQALDAGVKVTGCTVHFVDTGCDTGPIILQTPLSILPEDTVESLSARLLAIEHQTLVNAVALLENNKVILQGNKTLLRRNG